MLPTSGTGALSISPVSVGYPSTSVEFSILTVISIRTGSILPNSGRLPLRTGIVVKLDSSSATISLAGRSLFSRCPFTTCTDSTRTKHRTTA